MSTKIKDKPVGYVVRPRDMKSLLRELNRANAAHPGNLYDAARTLVGFAEPIDSLPLVAAEADVEALGDLIRQYGDRHDADETARALIATGRIQVTR